MDKFVDYFITRRGIKKGDIPNPVGSLYCIYCTMFETYNAADAGYVLLTRFMFIRELKRNKFKMKVMKFPNGHKTAILLNKCAVPPGRAGNKWLPPERKNKKKEPLTEPEYQI
jgi:hypothetical protein